LILIVIILLSFPAGLGLRRRLTVVLGPVGALIYGAALVGNERPEYDMHGLGYVIGAGGAVLALIAWLVGRWMRNLGPRRDA
jgi:drug/metabolite transporter (DMT)-like permease